MTPPAEGERARDAAKAWPCAFCGLDQEIPKGRHTGARECIIALKAEVERLRAPQPRGLTGEAIREACAKALDERRAHFQARWEARKHGTDESWWRARMTEAAECAAALRPLDLSAIEGAPAAGEREAARCACGLKEIPEGVGIVQWYWQRHAKVQCLLELPNARCECGLLRSEHIHGHAPASPRSTAPEDK